MSVRAKSRREVNGGSNNRQETPNRPSHRPRPTGKQNSDACGRCEVTVRVGDNGLLCDSCETWYHAGCQQVSAQMFKILDENIDLQWLCHNCKNSARRSSLQIKQLQEENKNLKEENTALKDRLKLLEEKVLNLENRFSDADANVGLDLEEITNKVVENIKEREEKQKRKNNIVMFNIPECRDRNVESRNNQDQGKSEVIIRDHLKINEFEILEVSRIGRAEVREEANVGLNQKPRPLLVKLKDQKMKWEIVARVKEDCKSGEADRTLTSYSKYKPNNGEDEKN